VPVRGRVLCVECATREVGIPAASVPQEPQRAFKVVHVAAAALFVVGLLATIAPWDQFGILTTVLSAWSPDPDPWPLVASVSFLVGTLAALALLVPRMRRFGRYSPSAYAILAIVAGTATTVELLGAPSYVIHSPAPYVLLAASALILALGAVMLRRRIP
jgi:O-antigen/teichoic acid export membrane protein